jgi:hypothetical protein
VFLKEFFFCYKKLNLFVFLRSQAIAKPFRNSGIKYKLMDRREFLRARKKNKTVTGALPRTNSGINPYSGTWGEQEIIHLLKRTMFGAKKADVDYFRSKTIDQVVDELLTPTAPNPNPPVKEYVTSTTPGVTPDGNIAQGTTWINDINSDGTVSTKSLL